MKEVIRTPKPTLEEIQRAYVRKITKTTESSGSYPIIEKHKLMMKAPVYDLPDTAAAIDLLMASTHIAPSVELPLEEALG